MGASGKPFLSGRVPQELYNAVNARAKETGKSRTDIMIEAVCAYLGLPTPTTPKTAAEQRIEELEQRMAQLEEKLEKMQPKPTPPPLSEFFSQERVDKHYKNKNGKL